MQRFHLMRIWEQQSNKKTFLKYFKRFIYGLLILIVSLVVIAYATGYGYLISGVRQTYLRGYTTAMPDDHKFFSNRLIQAGSPQIWKKSKNYNRYTLPKDFKQYLERYKTIAYLIIKDGKIEYEKYWHGYNKQSLTNSFSMSKTLVTLLLGKAIESGKIKGMDQKAGDFFPRYKQGLASELTLGDLSGMKTGLDWDENYSGPFSITAKSYYGRHLNDLVLGVKVVRKPGLNFDYVSGATQLLSMVIAKATGENLSTYLSENFWKPLGMNADGLWSLDRKDGAEKAFCCVNSNARNFAKIGQLLLQKGRWKGHQLLDQHFVSKITHPALSTAPEYGYGLWTDYQNDPAMYVMIGHDGQNVIVVPKYHMVIVRLGFYRAEAGKKKLLNKEIYRYLEGALQTLQLKR